MERAPNGSAWKLRRLDRIQNVFRFSTTPPHDGAIIHPKFGTTRIDWISGADGASKTLMVGELNYGLKNYMWGACKPRTPPNGAKHVGPSDIQA